MEYRTLGRTGWKVSAVSFGAWAIGGTWGNVNDADSLEALHRALDLGVNFFDTADVYGDGRSERLLGQLRRERKEKFIIATKAGRRLNPHRAEGYDRKNLTSFVEQSLKNLGSDRIDLLQLHCPPTKVYYTPEVFAILDDLVSAGRVQYYGVSVERIDEALKAIEYPNVQTVQIIFNMFRHRPSNLFFGEAVKRKVGILARLPLASGLLTGKFSKDSKFEPEDHRSFNRKGESFDRGETFSGVEYDIALDAIERLRPLCPAGMTLSQFALKWILMFDAVSCVIPGAKRKTQVEENVQSADRPPLTPETMRAAKKVYDEMIRKEVHHLW